MAGSAHWVGRVSQLRSSEGIEPGSVLPAHYDAAGSAAIMPTSKRFAEVH